MGCVASSKDITEELSYSKESNWIMAGTIVRPHNIYPGEFSNYTTEDKQDLPQSDNQKLANCDAFYVHWRSLLNCEPKEEANIRKEIEMHASVFNNCCRIYAPNFRSASDASDMSGINVAYNDIKKAFDHFLMYWSSTRPFIVAGEGQGSYLLLKLIQEQILSGNTDRANDLRKRIVCAYLPGCPVLPSDINSDNHLIEGQNPDDIKCVVSWCTDYGTDKSTISPCHYFFPGVSRPYQGNSIVLDDDKKEEGLVMVNPLTWKYPEDCPPRANKGSISFLGGVLYQKVCGASPIDKGGCIRVVYDNDHTYDTTNPLECQSDYLPFWMSIRINSALRLQQWSDKQNHRS
ncbi:hypothetical protein RFI_27821 [Reticulomyxa filosa]|uniref:DUF3089 domain-containing protein n=1 Tax=Reticulomyxa filosa TaxID=46433 RepID=X6M7C7_RETFI|nr:hypothetical protein RFI_27821 [Reticulomyxa filosa]|eukprot:ETO09556.1 hypothetical protein RFI_27821 [Reticulomyxa filosa]